MVACRNSRREYDSRQSQERARVLDDTNAWGYVAPMILMYCPSIWSGCFGEFFGFIWTGLLLLLLVDGLELIWRRLHDTMDALMTDRLLIIIMQSYLCSLCHALEYVILKFGHKICLGVE